MTARLEEQHTSERGGTGDRKLGTLGGVWLFLSRLRPNFFSSLTHRIVILNLAALIILVSGILFLNQFRAGLIDARLTSLRIQGEIIAGGIAASVGEETDAPNIGPEELLDLQIGEPSSPLAGFGELDFAINPERVAPVLRRLISPTGTRARIYDQDGVPILDSQKLYTRGRVFQLAAPPEPERSWSEDLWHRFNTWLSARDLPLYEEIDGNGRGYEEVVNALDGSASSIVRVNAGGELVVSVAVPIQRYGTVNGVLLLSTQGGDIDAIVNAERLAIIRVGLVAAGVTVLLSILLSATIAAPLHRLADAADRVRKRVSSRPQIPDFSPRGDEIGHLSAALREMTSALFNRISAIENFAADVAHELKNPLTSLRSAVETLPLVKNKEERERLSNVIVHDVRRLDRLISDISDASRLDAELARGEAVELKLNELLSVIVGMARESGHDDAPDIELTFEDDDDTYCVRGHDGRLAQVFTNLIDNARSFCSSDGGIRVLVSRPDDTCIHIVVEDDGPGIRADQFERIFERFYTDRADTSGFGQNSGLGLSISRQIVEAHHGRIWAENRTAPAKGESASKEPDVAGARFTVRLPAA